MNEKLTETLNLASPEDLGVTEPEASSVPPESSEDSKVILALEEAEEIAKELSVASRIDNELAVGSKLVSHDEDMDSITKKALKSYDDLIHMSNTMTDNYTARMYEVSSTMLKVALDAQNSKKDRKLKTLELQMKKLKMDRDYSGEGGEVASLASGTKMDRNELFELIRGGGNPSTKK